MQPSDDSGCPITKQVPRKGNGSVTTFETVPVPPTEYLDARRAVEQMTWAPGQPLVISDRLVSGGGWIERPGCHCFNLYRPPQRRTVMPALQARGSSTCDWYSLTALIIS